METEERGIRCPNCNCGHHYVTHTYHNTSNFGTPREHIRRRRVCMHCKLPFYTTEVVELEAVLQETTTTLDPSPKRRGPPKIQPVLDTFGHRITPPDLPNPFV
jgi:hypothetical protein